LVPAHSVRPTIRSRRLATRLVATRLVATRLVATRLAAPTRLLRRLATIRSVMLVVCGSLIGLFLLANHPVFCSTIGGNPFGEAAFGDEPAKDKKESKGSGKKSKDGKKSKKTTLRKGASPAPADAPPAVPKKSKKK
jgi:hypothetical protein